MGKVTREQVAQLINGMIFCHQWHSCTYGHCKMLKCNLSPEDTRIDLVMKTLSNHNLTLDDFARILEAYRRYFIKRKEPENTLMYNIREICLSFDMEVAKLGKITLNWCPSD